MTENIHSLRGRKIEETAFSDTQAPPKTENLSKPKEIITQNFTRSHQEYRSEMSRPQLENPSKATKGKSPLSTNEQRVVKFDFERYASERLEKYHLTSEQSQQVLNAVMNPDKKVELPSSLAKIAQNVQIDTTEAIQERYKLPNEWVINADKAQNWTPERSPSLERTITYNAGQQQLINTQYQDLLHKNAEIYIHTIEGPHRSEIISGLREALRTDKPADNVIKHYAVIKDLTAESIRQQHLLPAAWTPFTEEVQNWKALAPGSIDPALAAKLFTQSYLLNAENLIKETDKISKQLVADPKLSSIHGEKQNGDEEKSVHRVLREVAMALKLVQIADIKKGHKLLIEQEKSVDELKYVQDAIYDNEKWHENVSGWIGLGLNIVKWTIIAAVGIFIIVPLAIFFIATAVVDVMTAGATLGVKAGVIAAIVGITSLIISAIVTGFSIADAQMGWTSKLLEWIGKFIDSGTEAIFGGSCPKILKTLIRSALLVIVLLVVVVIGALLTAATFGKAAPGIALTTMTGLKQIINHALLQLTLGAVSGVIGTVISTYGQVAFAITEAILKNPALGLSAAAIQYISMAMSMVATVVASVFALILTLIIKPLSTKGLLNPKEALREFFKPFMLLDVRNWKGGLQSISKYIWEGKHSHDISAKLGGLKGIKAGVLKASEAFRDTGTLAENLAKFSTNTKYAMESFWEVLTIFPSPLEQTQYWSQFVERIFAVVTNALQAKFEMEQGSLESMIILIETTRELVQKSTKEGFENIESQEEWLTRLVQGIHRMMDSSRHVYSQLANSV